MKLFVYFFLLFNGLIIISCSPSIQRNKLVVNNQLKVMSYNIHHCNPPSKDGWIDVNAIANVIKKENPDIVGLQEVDINTARSGTINQAAELALKTGLTSYYFAKAIDYDGGDYGVAILSKYPLSDMKTYQLPMDNNMQGEPRVLATATVILPGGKKITFGCTHLDAQRNDTNRVLQIKKINNIVTDAQLPMIIAGDFNAEEESEVIRILDSQFKRTCKPCKPTIPATSPRKAIDFIAYKAQGAFSVLKHEVVNETYASDHLPVTAIFALNF